MPSVNLLCRASLGSGNAFCPNTVLQCTDVAPLPGCMNNKPSQVSLHWHMPAVNLLFRAAFSSGKCILPKPSAAVHWCWVAAQLYERQIFAGVLAQTYACCQPGLLTSTQQWKCIQPKPSAAVHWCWAAARLYEEQTFTGVFALTRACCQSAFQSSIQHWEMHFAQAQCCSALVLGRCTAV